jgi:alkylhydroperoxidase/carboxymuconolactone decarboxylase family protein YurZ
MATPVTIDERFRQWQKMYNAVRAELTPENFREATSLMAGTEGWDKAAAAINVVNIVMANDRKAAEVASSLVTINLRPEAAD